MDHHVTEALGIANSALKKPSRLALETALLVALRSMEYGRHAAQMDGEGFKDLHKLAQMDLPAQPRSGWAIRVMANNEVIVDLEDENNSGGSLGMDSFPELIRSCARLMMTYVGNGRDHLGNIVSMDVKGTEKKNGEVEPSNICINSAA